MRRSVGAIGIAATMVVGLAGLHASSASAAATGTVVVHGTELPLGLQLSFVGCDGLSDRTPEELHPYVGTGPATPPLGERSLGYDLDGGNAVGALSFVPSVDDATPTSVSVFAPSGTTGVAYAGYTSPAQRGTDRMWVGRASLTVPAGQWTRVTTGDLDYSWTQVDVNTGAPVAGTTTTAVAPPAASVRDFAATQHGDGPGFATLGFGCDGAPFDLDALQVGSSTYDFEGLDVSASIGASAAQVRPGDAVTLTGRLRDSSGALVPDGTLTLESRTGDGDWKTVQVADASSSDPSVTVRPDATTEYRFVSPQRDLADAAYSAPVTVTVSSAPPSPGASPKPTASASPKPTKAAPSTPTEAAPPKPSTSPKPAVTSSPSATASSSAAPSPTATAITSASPAQANSAE